MTTPFEWATLTLSFIQSVAWPLVVIVVATIFRQELAKWLRIVGVKIDSASELSGSAGPFNFRIAADIAQARVEIEAVAPVRGSDLGASHLARGTVDNETRSTAYSHAFAEISERLRAILVSWREGAPVPTDFRADQSAAVLEFNGLVPREVANAVRALTLLRTALDVTAGDELDEGTLQDGLELAARVLDSLRGLDRLEPPQGSE